MGRSLRRSAGGGSSRTVSRLRALERDAAAVGVDDPLGDGQPEAAAGGRPLGRLAAAVEAVEDEGQVGLGDVGPGLRMRDRRLPAPAVRGRPRSRAPGRNTSPRCRARSAAPAPAAPRRRRRGRAPPALRRVQRAARSRRQHAAPRRARCSSTSCSAIGCISKRTAPTSARERNSRSSISRPICWVSCTMWPSVSRCSSAGLSPRSATSASPRSTVRGVRSSWPMSARNSMRISSSRCSRPFASSSSPVRRATSSSRPGLDVEELARAAPPAARR